MSEPERFDSPRVAINRVYTRKGDGGKTRLVGGQKVAKHDVRIASYGEVDELNAFLGLARLSILEATPALEPADADAMRRLADVLLRVQHELFNLGSILATLPEDVHPKQPRVTAVDVLRLEQEIDRCNEELEPLRSFVLPGGCSQNAHLHVARTVCRRAERTCVQLAETSHVDEPSVAYLNRLSDALFVWSRWVSRRMSVAETLWDPNVTNEAAYSGR